MTRIQTKPLAKSIGLEISGVDVSQEIDPDTFGSIEAAWHQGCVVLFRNQRLSEDKQVRFAGNFGALAKVVLSTTGVSARNPSVMYVSNVKENGKLIGTIPDGEVLFHSDQCYLEKPAKATLLYAVEVPSKGGNTLFANMYLAYESLPEDLKKRIEGRRAMHIADYGVVHHEKLTASQRFQEVDASRKHHAHPVVRTHPATGRKALYVNRLLTAYIEDMPRSESDELLNRLFDHAENPEFVYEHVWSPGDLVVWDNRCVLHARTDFDATERRLLNRVAVLGETPY